MNRSAATTIKSQTERRQPPGRHYQKRQYSEDDKATALACLCANRGNQKKTARQCQIPRATLQKWIQGKGVSAGAAAKVAHKKGELADKLEALAHRLLDAMPDKIEAASLQSLTVALDVAIDKMRLLRGEATVTVNTEDTPAVRHRWAASHEGGWALPAPRRTEPSQ